MIARSHCKQRVFFASGGPSVGAGGLKPPLPPTPRTPWKLDGGRKERKREKRDRGREKGGGAGGRRKEMSFPTSKSWIRPWFLRFSKTYAMMAFAGIPFPCFLFSAFFKLCRTTNNQMKNTTRELFDVILFFFISFCVKLFFFCTTNCFP